jgi:hypothetical protein
VVRGVNALAHGKLVNGERAAWFFVGLVDAFVYSYWKKQIDNF